MRGVYLNADLASIETTRKFFEKYNKEHIVSFERDAITLIYNAQDWEKPPVIEWSDKAFLALVGWFIFDGELNPLNKFAESYRENSIDALSRVSAGIFVGVYFSHADAEPEIFNDPLGLSSHFFDASKKVLAPALGVFSGGATDKEAEAFYQATGFMFGSRTIYSEVNRLEPGSITTGRAVQKYYELGRNHVYKPENVPYFISKLINHWRPADRSLAISAGLDSRLILSQGLFDFGYTYGPEASGDRVVARRFSDCFRNYEEFDYDAPDRVEDEDNICRLMFHGSGNWVYRLLTAYKYAKDKSGRASIFFDGYLGDVLQRGEYIKFPGLVGEFFRLFPSLYKLPIEARWLLRKRYPKLSPELLDLFLDDFKARTKDLDLSEYQKVTYYEFLYGRGARMTINGGILTAGQLFTVVPVFTDLHVFESLIHCDQSEAIAFKLLKPIWKNVDARFTDLRTETFFKPLWWPWFISKAHFLGRVLVNFNPLGGNYAKQLKNAKAEEK